MPNLVRYNGEGEWSALYVDGKLVVVGDHYLTDERIAQIAGVKEIYGNNDFMQGGQHDKDVAKTVDEVEAYTKRRQELEARAAELRRQAAELLEQSRSLTNGI